LMSLFWHFQHLEINKDTTFYVYQEFYSLLWDQLLGYFFCAQII
jgi:hypothetical protein